MESGAGSVVAGGEWRSGGAAVGGKQMEEDAR